MLQILVAIAILSFCQALKVGVGIHDVTGPVGGVNMMGYAMPDQVTQGISQRLRARAFIFEQKDKRIVYVSLDTAMISQNIKRDVLAQLGDGYQHANVLLSATHTHSSVGGFNDYLLYGITSLGFIKESEIDLVFGIVGAIRRAELSLRESSVYVGEDKLFGANINRSPVSYQANPKTLRDQYPDGDTDKTMLTLKIVQDGAARGMISFFSVHGTSMNNTIRLVNGDNKGYAAWLMEKEMNGGGASVEYSPYLDSKQHKRVIDGSYFVAAFGQTQEGDVSPNTGGAFCLDTGAACDLLHSTCPDAQGRPRNKMCHARGPGFEKGSKESTRIIGLRQYLKARQIFTGDSLTNVGDAVDFAHAWIDMTKVTVALENGELVKTCKAARGYSFAAGTTDGPGAFDFIQGDNSTGNPFWNFVKQFVGAKASDEQIACHLPKPILLNTGEARKPYAWEASVVDIQIFRLGSVLILAVPAEFTTMAGRQLKAAIGKIFIDSGVIRKDELKITIAGLSNSYTGYVTTFEEYQIQRYEGASTIYGPHTLSAYIQEFKRLAYRMVGLNHSLPQAGHKSNIAPADFSSKLLTFLPPVVFDSVPAFKHFGQIVQDAKSQDYRDGDLVSATFYSGHPRNVAQNPILQLENTFARVEKFIGSLSLGQIQSMLVRQFSSQTVQLIPFADLQVLKFRLSRQLTIQNAESEEASQQFVYAYQVDGQTHFTKEYPKTKSKKDLWKLVRDDDDWDVTFHWWKDVAGISSVSYAKVEWLISARPDVDVVNTMKATSNGASLYHEKLAGQYRLVYKGAHKALFGGVKSHEGVSSPFTII